MCNVFVSFVGLSVLNTNGGKDCHEIIGAVASTLLKTLEKTSEKNLLKVEWDTWITTWIDWGLTSTIISHRNLLLSSAHSDSFCSSATHTFIHQLCCPTEAEWTRPSPQALRPPIGGPLWRCVGVRWRGGTLRAAAGDCDVRAQQPGREPAWRSQILRGLRGRWERGPGRQHEDRHGAIWGRRRHRLGARFVFFNVFLH